MNRRHFISSIATIGTIGMINPTELCGAIHSGAWYMPEESEPHSRTWMGFVAEPNIWGRRLAPKVKANLAHIANTIIDFEPVSMLVQAKDLSLARDLLNPKVELVTAKLNDLWLRDTGPTFVVNANGQKAAVDLNFNGWGNKQAHSKDAKVAQLIANRSKVLSMHTDLVLEGGCVEVDGHGTAIITESCVLNENRNPGVSKAQFEDQLMPLLGLEKIIWLPGIKGQDITDGHTDFYARFVRPGCVVAGLEMDDGIEDYDITRAHLEILKSATDAQGKPLHVETLESPLEFKAHPTEINDFAAGYIGYYVCNGAVIAQKFGDEITDHKARQTLSELFPERKIIQLSVDAIAAGGGSIHCATQQEPRRSTAVS